MENNLGIGAGKMQHGVAENDHVPSSGLMGSRTRQNTRPNIKLKQTFWWTLKGAEAED